MIKQIILGMFGKIPSKFGQTINRQRRLIVIGCHLLLIGLANVMAFLLRFEGVVPGENLEVGINGLPHVLLIYMGCLWGFGLFQGLWRYVGIHDLIQIIWACVAGAVISYLWLHEVLGWGTYPRSVIILTGLLSIGLVGGIRLVVRWFREWMQEANPSSRRILIVGAGSAAELLSRDLQANLSYGYTPVVLVDDDPQKTKAKIHGIPVAGTINMVEAIAKKYNVDEIVIAIPSASPQTIQKIVEACETCLLPIKTLPNVRQLLDGPVTIRQVHPLTLEDLLQREPVQTDLQELHSLIEAKTILVTGAGGSIGSELCRQIAKYQPSLLILFERYENNLHAIDRELKDVFPQHRFISVVGDITVSDSLRKIINEKKPDLIFHAAAHKHVPLMEENPEEAVINNIVGTRRVAEIAMSEGVGRFIFISSDKAVNPINVMGMTKRIGEFIVQDLNRLGKTSFSVVRFGNVLGSNGSVVPLFAEQIRKGGPVTVTHHDVKRFFMTIPEAVQLILQASFLGEGGDVFVLDMGEQIRISQLAKSMIRLSGFVPDRDIKISYIGLRPGEKMCEELFDSNEIVKETVHSKIKRAESYLPFSSEVLRLYVKELMAFVANGKKKDLILKLEEMIQIFQLENVGRHQELEFFSAERKSGVVYRKQ